MKSLTEASPQQKQQFYWGLGLLIIMFPASYIMKEVVQFRFLMGALLGFALIKGNMGFAGTINRAYRTGSFRLMKMAIWFFVASSFLMGAIFIGTDITQYRLSIKSINLGLMLGAFLFGVGMAFATACASGIIADLGISPIYPAIALVTFFIGAFIGFYPQAYWSITKDTWFATATSPKGVFLPDFFGGITVRGIIGGSLAMLAIGLIFTYVVIFFEKRLKTGTACPWRVKGVCPHMKKEGRCLREATGVCSCITAEEATQEKLSNIRRNKNLFEKIFILPWSLWESCTVLIAGATALFLVAHKSWGVTTSFGLMFGRILHLFGVSTEAIVSYTGRAAKSFTSPIIHDGGQMQNFGLFIGALIASLMMGLLTVKDTYSFRKVLLYILAGLLMGFGTRLASGCNIGALFSALAHFSLSGWIFFIFMILGGLVGNIFKEKFEK